MSTMGERFKRAYKVLDEDLKLAFPLKGERVSVILENGIDLRALRNEANLWEDYIEDKSWIIGGVNCDPNHPDNLSDIVYKHWLMINRI